jgi:hypothetical protein
MPKQFHLGTIVKSGNQEIEKNDALDEQAWKAQNAVFDEREQKAHLQ